MIAYPNSFEDDYDEDYFFGADEPKLTRPLSVPGSPRMRSGLMTPGDFASLQEGHEGLSTEDYIAWKLPYVIPVPTPSPSPVLLVRSASSLVDADRLDSEEEDGEDYPFPLTLKQPKRGNILGSMSPVVPAETPSINGSAATTDGAADAGVDGVATRIAETKLAASEPAVIAS